MVLSGVSTFWRAHAVTGQRRLVLKTVAVHVLRKVWIYVKFINTSLLVTSVSLEVNFLQLFSPDWHLQNQVSEWIELQAGTYAKQIMDLHAVQRWVTIDE
eukprot:SAG31_NODE_3370_length_4353_cov_5.039962_3_plen_100_part_00